jgi:hypothetical protein
LNRAFEPLSRVPYARSVDYRENAAPQRFDCRGCGAQRPQEESVYNAQGELVCRSCDANARVARIGAIALTSSPERVARVQFAQGALAGLVGVGGVGFVTLVALLANSVLAFAFAAFGLAGLGWLAAYWWTKAKRRVHGVGAALAGLAGLGVLVAVSVVGGQGPLLLAVLFSLVAAFGMTVGLVIYLATTSMRR